LLQLACFDQQKEELASLVDLFAQADAATVKEAAGATRRLPGPSACANARSLSLVEPPPEAQRSPVAELRKALVHAIALRNAGKHKEALAQIPELVARARSLAYPPVLAEALYIFGRIKDGNEDYKTSAELDECERIAVASRMDALAARAAARRFADGAYLGGDPAVLRIWQDRARTWIDREHDLEAESMYAVGTAALAQNAGDYPAALKALERANQLMSQLYGPDSLAAMGQTSNVAFTMTLTARYEEAIKIYEDLTARMSRAYGDDTDDLANTLDNEGMALGLVGRYADALAVLNRGAGMKAASEVSRGGVQCDSSRALLGLGRVAEAIEAGERGVELLKHAGIGGVNLANNFGPLAASYLAAHRYDDALALARGCLAVFRQERKTDQADEGPCLAAEGTALLELGKARDAIPILEATVALQSAAPITPGVLANARYQLARALVTTRGDRERAKQLVRSAREELEKYPFERPLLDELVAWQAKTL
jgi:tetratricopeptide (TPR) repeat protein